MILNSVAPGQRIPPEHRVKGLDSMSDTHFLMQFVYACYFGRLHLEQRHEERERGFSSLIFVHAVRMKAVTASTCRCVVKRNLQIVLA
jgi:hypothetical protein